LFTVVSAFLNLILSTPFVVKNDGDVGVGLTSPTTKFHTRQTAASSTAEEIARFDVSDDTDSYLSIQNITSTDNTFTPGIVGKNSTTLTPLTLIADATTDSATASVMNFNARRGAAAFSTVSSRPLFTWTNYTSEVMRIRANGNVGIGTTNPLTKLSVDGELTRNSLIARPSHQLTTTNNTPTTIAQIMIASSTVTRLKINVVGQRRFVDSTWHTQETHLTITQAGSSNPVQRGITNTGLHRNSTSTSVTYSYSHGLGISIINVLITGIAGETWDWRLDYEMRTLN
jgi:hypothetical protein